LVKLSVHELSTRTHLTRLRIVVRLFKQHRQLFTILKLRNMSARTKFILGLVGAAATGVVIGLLLAPEAGSDTRRRITDTAGDWTNSLGDILSDAKDGIGSIARKGSRKTSDAVESYS
jgi:hypothetical protein